MVPCGMGTLFSLQKDVYYRCGLAIYRHIGTICFIDWDTNGMVTVGGYWINK